jgi:hypothetical protein
MTQRSRVLDRCVFIGRVLGFNGSTYLRATLRARVIECRRQTRTGRTRCGDRWGSSSLPAGHQPAQRVGACESGVGVLRKERRQERDSQGSSRPIRRVPASRRSGGGRVGLLPCDEGKARPLEDSPTHRSASAMRDAVQVNGGPYSSGMSEIGTLSTWCPCWSTTETNHPCQFRPG